MNLTSSVTPVKVAILAGVVLIVGCSVYVFELFFGGNEFAGAAEKTFYVARGEPFSAIVDSLKAQGIIRDEGRFVVVAKIYGGTSRLKVGKYVFHSGVSNSAVFLDLRSGRGNVLVSVTVPEGLTARGQARVFRRALGIDSARYVDLAYDENFVRSLGVDARSLEGFLFPQTYTFSWEQEERDIIRQQVEQFRAFYNDSLREQAAELNWTTLQVLTLASIVEGEARRDDERPLISGVYHNRLRKGMRLEADPTIQFILPDGPRRVMYADLKIDNPYNTYRYAGLPPGPVNNPGRASILAALFPANSTYLYFVADGQGGHRFSSTYSEHQRNVRLYRHRRARARTISLRG